MTTRPVTPRPLTAGATLAALLALAALPAAARAQAGRPPVTHETLFLMKRVGSPAPSPDGKWVVFSLSEPAYDEKKETSDLWIVPADGSAPPRRLTAGKGSESAPAWSPDSRRIAFAARRDDDEVNQLYVLDVAGGGEARRLTTSPLAARSPKWSPDGRQIAYQSSAYPGAADLEANRRIAGERKDPKSKVRIYESFPIRRWDRWLDDTQAHLYVIPADGEGAARDVLAGTQLVAGPGYRRPQRRRLHRGPRPGVDARLAVARVRGHHGAQRGRLPAREHAPVPGAGGRRRAPRARHREHQPLQPHVLARRAHPLLRRGRGVGPDLRHRQDRLHRLAVERRGHGGDAVLRPLGGRLRVLRRRPHALPLRRGRRLREAVLGAGGGRRR